jgi:diacylglycerol O-acyltransferase / wax synthase
MSAMASVAIPALANMTRLPVFQLPSMLPSMLPIPGTTQPAPKLPTFADATKSVSDTLGLPTGFGFGPKTPLNVSITNQRSFAGRTVSLVEAKADAKKAGVSLNDLVMAACAGALKRYMADANVTLDKPMTAAVPVSLREAGNTDPNNQVTMMLASLATDIKDPLARLKAIHASTSASKELTGSFKAAIPTDFPSFGAPWIMTSLATLFGRSKLTDQLPPLANVAISNVPGVPVALYIAGAKVNTYFPVSIPSHGCALNITVQSYNGQLDYGLTACRRAVPDVDDIADHIVAAHAELHKLIAALPGPAASAKPAVAEAEIVAAPKPAALPAPAAAPRAAVPAGAAKPKPKRAAAAKSEPVKKNPLPDISVAAAKARSKSRR